MNVFGKRFRVSVFGESHGRVIGTTVDGVTPGIPLCEEDFKDQLDRRRPGLPGTTARKEKDIPQIVSGVFNGVTTGAPLTILFENDDARSADYDLFADMPRPGHADFAASRKYAFNDMRGGGHFSGRLTLPLVAAGVVADRMLKEKLGLKWSVKASLASLGGERDSDKWKEMLDSAASEGDSLGGIVECVAEGLPVGLGSPFWDSVESLVSHAVFSIPGVRGIEFGDGFAASEMKGSEHNDPFGPDGFPMKNGSGGVNGGLSNGAPLVFRVAFKPTSSIRKPQRTFNFRSGRMEELLIPGRHDVCFALRTPVVVESVTSIVIADLVM